MADSIRVPLSAGLRSAFRSISDGTNTDLGVRPVIFDIIAPDMVTSVLPEGLQMMLHVNPSTMSVNRSKIVTRTQTQGGFVEAHWGEAPSTISFEMATGGFIRAGVGVMATTGPNSSAIGNNAYRGRSIGGNRRETIAHDKYMDVLALFHNNGNVTGRNGQIVSTGAIKITYDDGVYLGRFSTFSRLESTDKAYQFALTAEFLVEREVFRVRH